MSSTNSRIAKANQILDRAEKMLLGGMSKQQALDIMSKCWNGLSFALGNIDNPLGNAQKMVTTLQMAEMVMILYMQETAMIMLVVMTEMITNLQI